MHRFRDEAGVSLVEILVTFVLLGITFSAFFQVIIGGLQSLSESRARQAASQVATELIEDLRSHAPSEVAMYVNPLVTDATEFNPSGYSCSGTAGSFDPDGTGPAGCETIVVNQQGAVLGTAPYQGTVASSVAPLTVQTIATEASDPGVPAGTVRVTVVVTYQLPAGAEEIRRSALFSEVSRG